MELNFYHVDAFSNKAFAGNPAAVFVLDAWLADETMQAIAMEFNLSETVFSVWEGDYYRIRWFTPEVEIPLCGHATLATSHVLHTHLGWDKTAIPFMSLSGPLHTHYQKGVHTLDFPASPPTPITRPGELEDILGCPVLETLGCGHKLIALVENRQTLEAIQPRLFAMTQLSWRAVCVTAAGDNGDPDFVCRFFAPAIGINEDPVTGSAYTMLGPYFANKTGKTLFKARQLSRRGGDVGVDVRGDRVLISGAAHTVMQGKFYLDSL